MALPAADTFTRANGGLGANWTTVTSQTAPVIVGNLVQTTATGGADSVARWSADTFPNDQFSEIKIVAAASVAANAVGAVVRADSAADTFYAAIAQGPLGAAASIILKKKIATVSTALITSTLTLAAGDMLRLSVTGTQLVVLVNGVARLSTVDSSIAAGSAGIHIASSATGGVTAAQLDDWSSGIAAANIHILTGRGNVAISSPLFLGTAISGRPSRLSSGQAEPPNWYHVGMISWASANGAMAAYPVTRDADLVALPPGMTTLYYEFASGITATITELTSP
jgi:hypothetical protein